MKTLAVFLISFTLVTISCSNGQIESPFKLFRSNDSLIIINSMSKIRTTLGNDLPSDAKYSYYFDSTARQVYIYYGSSFYNYSLDSNKISNKFIIQGKSALLDSGKIEKIPGNLLCLNTQYFHYVFNSSLSKWFNLQTLVDEKSRLRLDRIETKSNNKILTIEYNFIGDSSIIKNIAIDTLKLRDSREHLEMLIRAY